MWKEGSVFMLRRSHCYGDHALVPVHIQYPSMSLTAGLDSLLSLQFCFLREQLRSRGLMRNMATLRTSLLCSPICPFSDAIADAERVNIRARWLASKPQKLSYCWL